jgi:hypothetical protein
MILTEFQYYCSQLLTDSDNSAKIFGVVKYAPVAYFAEGSEWFVRADGTIASSGIVLKSEKSWMRAPQTIYTNRLTVQEGRDAQGITYRTNLSGTYVPHSAATLNELHQACRLPLIAHITTATGEYVLGTPENPVRLQYSFDNLEKYNFTWSQLSVTPPRGFTDASTLIPPVGGGNGGTTIESLAELIDAIFGTMPYRNDDVAKAAGRNIGELYILSADNDYSFDLYRTPKRILE